LIRGAVIALLSVPVSWGCERTAERPQPATTPARTAPLLQSTDRPETILETAIRAYGGADKFSRWATGRIKYKTAGGIAVPVPGVDFNVEEFFQFPGRFKRVARVGDDPARTTTFVINGDAGWVQNRLGTRPMPQESLRAAQKTRHTFTTFFDLTQLQRPEVKLTAAGGEKVNGHDAVVLKVEEGNGPLVHFYFDRLTALLVQTRKKIPAALPNLEGAVAETSLSDYRDIEGGKVPMSIVSRSEGKVLLNVTILEVQFLDRLDEGVFAKP
jgi:hypothetical protein